MAEVSSLCMSGVASSLPGHEVQYSLSGFWRYPKILSVNESLNETDTGSSQFNWNLTSIGDPQTSLTSTLISCFWFFKRSMLVWFDRIEESWSPSMHSVNIMNNKLSKNKNKTMRKSTSLPQSKLFNAQAANRLRMSANAYPHTTAV